MSSTDVKVRAEPTQQLLFSETADRAASASPEGNVIVGNTYIFVSPTDTATAVDYYIDDVFYVRRTVAPFDLAGASGDDALPYDTNTLGYGVHTIKAVVETPTDYYTLDGRFLVESFADTNIASGVVTIPQPTVTATSSSVVVTESVVARAAVPVVTVTTPVTPPGTIKTAYNTLGVYRGGQTEAQVAAYEGTNGINRGVHNVVVFATNATNDLNAWKNSVISLGQQFQSRQSRTVLSISIVQYPHTGSTYPNTMAMAAAGDYDTYYTQMAQGLANLGYDATNLIIRCGWGRCGTPWRRPAL